ncbi:MAG: GNAT family N-acetyltransferase [Ekhidna sp.]
MEIASKKTILNTEKNQFELLLEDYLAFIAFRRMKNSNDIYMTHTEVPTILEGKGIGHKLVRESLDIAENEGFLIVPLCPFVRGFIFSNLEDYKNILSPKTKM